MCRLPDFVHFRTFGFVVLRDVFDPAPLAREIDECLGGADAHASAAAVGVAQVRFRYAPMMTGRTPASLALLDWLESVAASLLGSEVLPTRAKGVRYAGDTAWHVDSAVDVESVGCAAYLEPLRAENGALRVISGSQRRDLGDAIRAAGGVGLAADALPACVVATDPGDVVVFDEHLFHASLGGDVRTQWRVDYVRQPAREDEAGWAGVKAYYAAIYPADGDCPYDVERHPSYGADWTTSGRRAARALGELGVYEMAARQETVARARALNAGGHRPSTP